MTDQKSFNNNSKQQQSDIFHDLGLPFQEKVMQALIVKRKWAQDFVEVFDLDACFEYAYLKLLGKKYIEYYKKYKEFPSVELLISIIKEDLKENVDGALKQQIITFLGKVMSHKEEGDLGWVMDRAYSYCRSQTMKKAIITTFDLVNDEDKYESIVNTIKTAMGAGTPVSPGLDYNEDIDTRYSETYRRTISTGIEELDQKEILNGGLGTGEIGVIVAPTGCHARGTKILMYSGLLKNVEDVEVGELLMGPDSKPRKVLQLCRGREEMYEIIPVKGESFVVNKNHILSLKNTTTKEIVNLTVDEWHTKNKEFKHLHKLYRTNCVEFEQEQTLPLPPYLLGLLLGDAWLSSLRVELTTADPEIEEYFNNWLTTNGFGIRNTKKEGNKAKGIYGVGNKKLKQILKRLNLLGAHSGTKFIPNEYKFSSVKDRKQILAGLMDTDGSNGNNCYDYISKSKQLASDVVFIARSLGLAAYMKQCTKSCQTGAVGTYYRVSISGNTNMVPCLLKRKQCLPRGQKKDVLVTGFQIKNVGTDDFYGFQLDGDHLYVMGDFTVTHNSGKTHVLTHFGSQALLQGKNVVHYTLELNERVTGIRYDSHLTQIASGDCIEKRDEIKKFFEENKNTLGRLIIKQLPSKSTTVNTFRAHLDKLKITKNFVPDLLIVDYAGIMRSTEKYELPRFELKQVVQDLRDFAEEMDIPCWTALQSNKEGMNAEFVDVSNMSEAYSQGHIADFIGGLSRKSKDKASGVGKFFVAKNRAGIDGKLFNIHLDTARSTMKVISEVEAEELKEEAALQAGFTYEQQHQQTDVFGTKRQTIQSKSLNKTIAEFRRTMKKNIPQQQQL